MRLNFIILFILSLQLLISCNDTGKHGFVKDSEIKDSLNDFRSIRDTNFDRNTISKRIDTITINDLKGTWKDTTALYFENDKWYSFRPIDKTKTYNFFESTKYRMEEKNTYSKIDKKLLGQFLLKEIRDSSFLTLLHNGNNDTSFVHGDTAIGVTYLIESFDEKYMVIRPFDINNRKAVEEAFVLVKKNN